MREDDRELKKLLERFKGAKRDLENPPKDVDKTFNKRVNQRIVDTTESQIIDNIEKPSKKESPFERLKKKLFGK